MQIRLKHMSSIHRPPVKLCIFSPPLGLGLLLLLRGPCVWAYGEGKVANRGAAVPALCVARGPHQRFEVRSPSSACIICG